MAKGNSLGTVIKVENRDNRRSEDRIGEIITSNIYLDSKSEWIYINGKQTKYKITNYGSVINTRTNQIMRGGKDKNGYHIISLTLDRKKYTRKVHRLVAQAFIPNPDNLPEVNHINGNKSDNRVTNLEWVSSAENTHHACETGLRYSKLDKGTVVAICKELEKGELRVSDIARKFDIFDMDVSKIRNGQTWLSISKYFDVKNCNFNRGLVGENNNNSSITSGIAKNVCELLEKGYTPTEISKKLNISRRISYGIKYREAWNHISKDYSF